jgi:hypothetical protein
MAKRAPSYRPYRKFAVGALTPQSMTDNNPSVLVNALILHECGTLSDMSDMSNKSDFIGVPQVQKK